MATSTLTASERHKYSHMKQTPQVGTSQVTYSEKGPSIHPDPQTQDLLWESFGHSLQAAAIEFKKLWEPKVAKLMGGYSSYASLIFQLLLKDIWMYVLECHLTSYHFQIMKDYTSEHAQFEVEYYLGLTPKSKQSF